MKRPGGGNPSSLHQMASPNDMDYGVVGMEADGDAEEEMMACGGGGGCGGGEKKRRLSAEQTKQLERDYNALRHSYDALRVDHDALRRDKEALLAEVRAAHTRLNYAAA
ncbi:unnamed protein product [Triticum turgidum subsp. durum]|uniref:Homeobox-leucine zipper protein n=1 Tax=Triticum turgidum subsp. durum TaxID=4567 RepID=A0A9R1AMG6_TRITD|nr:unnamed protein product [Triticum turgidum subsp. durum]